MVTEPPTLAPGALAERERVLRVLRALGVARLWLFGSLAGGEAVRRSDVDQRVAGAMLDLADLRADLMRASRA
jgi:predicted nucleotidyltransferase